MDRCRRLANTRTDNSYSAERPPNSRSEKTNRLADKKPKFYVVWQGREPGVYSTWDACQKQISGFSGAKYKSFDSMANAKAAFQQDADEHWGKGGDAPKKIATPVVDFQELSGL